MSNESKSVFNEFVDEIDPIPFVVGAVVTAAFTSRPRFGRTGYNNK